MEASTFNIYSMLPDDQVIIYNTFSTSLIVIPISIYNQIFVNSILDDTETVNQLQELGFLVSNTLDELSEIELMRKEEIERTDEQVVTIFSTNGCNARCYYCFEKGINDHHMSEITALDTVSFIKDFYPEKELSIKWFGGEPLYNFGAIRTITDELRNNGYTLKAHITSNGSLLTQEIIDYFKDNYEIVTFQVTIDDVGENYYRIKKYIDLTEANAFQTVVDNCKMLIDNNIYVSIRINYLFQKLDDAIEIFHKLETIFSDCDPELYIIYLAAITLPQSDKKITPEEYRDLSIRALLYNRRHNQIEEKDSKYQLYLFDLLPQKSPCAATNVKNLSITADGYIFKCHRFAQHDNYSIGHVSKGVDINHFCYSDFVDYHITNPDCRACNILPICQGGCKAIQQLNTGDLFCDLKELGPSLVRAYYDYIIDKDS